MNQTLKVKERKKQKHLSLPSFRTSFPENAAAVDPSFWRDRQVTFSPYGSQIAFVSDRHQDRNAIYIIKSGKKKGGWRPFFTWHKPSILLCNERSVSNAEIFSHAYKNLKLGKLVGMPTYGGVISTRTIRILDGTWFRIPLRGWWALPTKKNMENGPAVSTDRVPLLPKDELRGHDPQLLKATRLLLKQLAAKK